MEPDDAIARRIFVASLADYVDGRLFGVWLDVVEDEDAMAAAITAMLEKSPTPGAEEWVVLDAMGFGKDVRVDADWSLSDVTDAARRSRKD